MLLGVAMDFYVIAFTRGGPPPSRRCSLLLPGGAHRRRGLLRRAQGRKHREGRLGKPCSTSTGFSLRNSKKGTIVYIDCAFPAKENKIKRRKEKEGRKRLPRGQLIARLTN